MSGNDTLKAAARARMHTVSCHNCGRTNRIPAAAQGSPKCGNCHQPLPWIVDADHRAPHRPFAAAGRELALVLRTRGVRVSRRAPG